MYGLIRRIFFLFDAEQAHYLAMNILKAACSISFIRNELQKLFTANSKGLEKNIFGIHFNNGIGLGAGFDKNALYLRELETLGFGFVEIGTVTPKPQSGNDKPRLFRLPKDKALINRMGFNNDGVAVIADRLKKWRESEVDNWQMTVDRKEKEVDSWQLAVENIPSTTNDQPPTNTTNKMAPPSTANRQLSTLIIGGNIGKNKATPNEDAWKDYEICFTALHPYVDFFVVNVSSPNTPGLRELQEKESLQKILTHLQNLNKAQPVQKPILLKIAPDLTTTQIDDVIELAIEIKLDGLVACNTTISREALFTPAEKIAAIGAGGLSGKPVGERSTEVIQYIYNKTGGALPVIGSGGIFNSADAAQKMSAGASLIEVWTGFIYEGPFIVKKICNGLEQIAGAVNNKR